MTLRDYLVAHGLSQTEFAAVAGVPVTTLHGWLSGRRTPSLSAMRRICAATGNAVQPNDWAAEPAAA